MIRIVIVWVLCVLVLSDTSAQSLEDLNFLEAALDNRNISAVDTFFKSLDGIDVDPYDQEENNYRWQGIAVKYLYQNSEHEQLFSFIDDCLVNADLERQGDLILLKGEYYRYISKPDSTIKYLDIYLNKYPNDLDKSLKAYWHKGIAYDMKGNSSESIKILVEADSLGQESQDTFIRSRILNSIGVVANSNRSYELALEYYKKSYTLIDTLNDQEGLAMYYLNIGDSYKYLKEYEKSRISVDKSIGISRNHNLTNTLLNGLGAKGYLYYQQGDLDNATKIYEEKLEVERTIGNDQRLASSILTLAYYHSLRKDRKKAYGFFNEAENMLKDIQVDQLKNQMYAVKKEISYNFGDYKQAYQDFARYKGFKDSLNEVGRKAELDDLLVKYETEKNEKEIVTLNLENEKKDSVIRRSRIVQGLFGSLALALIGLMFFVRKQFQNKSLLQDKQLELEQEKIKQLEAENKLVSLSSMLNGQEEERNRLARDLHDGLGGMMASISNRYSSLIMNHPSLPSSESTKTQAMINEACEELRRISRDLVPASLYLMGLDGAVEDMMERYQSEYNLVFDLQVIGKAKSLDEKQKVLVYRMIQELLHNTIKHAEADHVLVQLHYDNEDLKLLVEDNGKGFNIEDKYQGLGMRSLQSRIDFLGGNIQPYSEKGKGTSIQISIPYSYDKSFVG